MSNMTALVTKNFERNSSPPKIQPSINLMNKSKSSVKSPEHPSFIAKRLSTIPVITAVLLMSLTAVPVSAGSASKSWSKSVGAKDSVAAELSLNAKVSNSGTTSLQGIFRADVNGYIFNHVLSQLLSASVQTDVNHLSANPLVISVNYQVLRITLYSGSCKGSLQFNYKGTPFSASTPEYTEVFSVGPVPVTVGVKGTVSLSYSISSIVQRPYRVNLSTGPKASAGVTARLAVGIPGAEVGFSGSVAMFSEQVMGALSQDYNNTLNTSVDAGWAGPSGSLSIYLKILIHEFSLIFMQFSSYLNTENIYRGSWKM